MKTFVVILSDNDGIIPEKIKKTLQHLVDKHGYTVEVYIKDSVGKDFQLVEPFMILSPGSISYN